MKRLACLAVLCLGIGVGPAVATPPSDAQIRQWQRDRNTTVLETAPCEEITWLLADKQGAPLVRQNLGWWGRGFVEGAIYMMHSDKVNQRVADFGLTVDVVASHIAAYCSSHPKDVPYVAVQDLLLKAMK